MRVVAYLLSGNGGAMRTVPAMVQGARVCGESVVTLADTRFHVSDAEKYDAAIFWGYVETLQSAMRAFTERNKPVVYIDNGYWMREAFYKVSMNARHPTEYFQNIKHDDVRRKMFKVEPKPYRTGNDGHILIAGLSQKAAWAEHEGPWGEYEDKVFQEIRKYTGREIVYRNKTTGKGTPIKGTRYSDLKEPLQPLLDRAWCVVSRHSNVVVDGHVAGVPSFAWYGVGKPVSLQDLSMIEMPYYPGEAERLQWLNDIAYCQWSVTEMKDGTVWRHLKNEGLLG